MAAFIRGIGLVASVFLLCAVLAARVLAQDTPAPKANAFEPKADATPGQLRAHLERLQKAPPATRSQADFKTGYLTTCDKILAGEPSANLRSFALVSLMDALHYWAEASDAEASNRLAELAAKHAADSDNRVATTAAYYALEQKVLAVDKLPPAEVATLLAEVKTALQGKTLNAKHQRIATALTPAINRLTDSAEAERYFKDFGRMFAASTYRPLATAGQTMKTAQHTPIAASAIADPTTVDPAMVGRPDFGGPPGAPPPFVPPPVAPAPVDSASVGSAPGGAIPTQDAVSQVSLAGVTLDGTPFDISASIGNVVLVVFWASGSDESRALTAKIKDIHARYVVQGLQIVGVCMDDNRETMSQTIEEQQLSWVNLVGQPNAQAPSLSDVFGIAQAPATLLVDREGKIIARDLPAEELEARLAALMPGGETAGPPQSPSQ